MYQCHFQFKYFSYVYCVLDISVLFVMLPLITDFTIIEFFLNHFIE